MYGSNGNPFFSILYSPCYAFNHFPFKKTTLLFGNMRIHSGTHFLNQGIIIHTFIHSAHPNSERWCTMKSKTKATQNEQAKCSYEHSRNKYTINKPIHFAVIPTDIRSDKKHDCKLCYIRRLNCYGSERYPTSEVLFSAKVSMIKQN